MRHPDRDKRRQQAEHHARHGGQAQRGDHRRARLPRKLRGLRSRQREEPGPQRFHEGRGDEPSCQCHRRDRERHRNSDRSRSGDAGVHEPLEQEPLTDESVERRKSDDRDGADREAGARGRHTPHQSAHLVEVAGTGRLDRRAGSEEQQRLEDPVVEDVEKRCGHEGGAERRMPVARERQRGADADEDETNVLGRRVGQKHLEVRFDQRVQDPEERRRGTECEHGEAPPARPGTEHHHPDAKQAVDAHFHHRTRHQGGNMARRLGMCAWQPYVQRNHARFGSEADDSKDEHRRPPRGREVRRTRLQGAEQLAVRVRAQDAERNEDRDEAEMGHRRVPRAGPPRLLALCRCSTITRNRLDRAIDSHANKKVVILDAARTTTMLRAKSGKSV